MYRTNLTTNIGTEAGTLASRNIQDNFTFLSHYEASFHFLVKRVHNYASLRSNIFRTTLQLRQSPKTNAEMRQSQLTAAADILILLATSVNRSHTVSGGVLNPFYTQLPYAHPRTKSTTSLSSTKDVITPS